MSACRPAIALRASVSPSLGPWALLKIALQAGFTPELSLSRGKLQLRSRVGSPSILQVIFVPVLASSSRAVLF